MSRLEHDHRLRVDMPDLPGGSTRPGGCALPRCTWTMHVSSCVCDILMVHGCHRQMGICIVRGAYTMAPGCGGVSAVLHRLMMMMTSCARCAAALAEYGTVQMHIFPESLIHSFFVNIFSARKNGQGRVDTRLGREDTAAGKRYILQGRLGEV